MNYLLFSVVACATASVATQQPTERPTSRGIEIFVETPENTTLSFKIDPSALVARLKDKIVRHTYIPLLNQQLKLHGKLLFDEARLSDFGIGPGSVLSLTVDRLQEDVYVKTLAGETITLTINPFAVPVSSVKERLALVLGIPSGEQRLVREGKHLKDDERLGFSGTAGVTRLQMVTPLEAFQGEVGEVFVKILSGAIYAIEIGLTETVASLKNTITDMTGAPQRLQRLVYDYKQLDDENHLCDYGIRAGSSVLLVFYSPSVKDATQVGRVQN